MPHYITELPSPYVHYLQYMHNVLNRILIGSSMFEIEYNLNDCKEACCAVYESYDSNFETERYLWLRADIAYELGIYKENDYQNIFFYFKTCYFDKFTLPLFFCKFF